MRRIVRHTHLPRRHHPYQIISRWISHQCCPSSLLVSSSRRPAAAVGRESTFVSLALPAPDHKAWMPRSCCSSDVDGASMSYPRSRSGRWGRITSHGNTAEHRSTKGHAPDPFRRPMTSRCKVAKPGRIRLDRYDLPATFCRRSSPWAMRRPDSSVKSTRHSCWVRPWLRAAASTITRPAVTARRKWVVLVRPTATWP